MLNVSNVKVTGFDEAIRGMRNSWNSWEKSDSTTYEIGEKDLNLMVSLINEGTSASKYRRLITVYEIGRTRLNSSHVTISYAVFCLKKKK